MSAAVEDLPINTRRTPGAWPKNEEASEQVRQLAIMDPDAWAIRKQIIEPHMIILVMGETGSGKSSLIKAFGAEKQYAPDGGNRAPVVGETMKSETKDVASYAVYRNARKVVFVDTPGFNDTDMEDTQILLGIAEYLGSLSLVDSQVSGVVWLQAIDDPKFGDRSKKNLKLFHAITGLAQMSVVSLLTTKWSLAATNTVLVAYAKRERELREERWAELIENHACILRDNDPALLDSIIQQSKGTEGLALQQELITQKKSLADTASGQILIQDSKFGNVEESLKGLLDAIAKSRKENKPTPLLEDSLKATYLQYTQKRQSLYALEQWTFDKMVGKWIGVPAVAAGGSVGGLAAVAVASGEGGTFAAIAAGGITMGAAAALATGGVALVIVGGVLLAQHWTKKPLPETELDRRVRAIIGVQKKVAVEALETEVMSGESNTVPGTVVGRFMDRLSRPIEYGQRLKALEVELLSQSPILHSILTDGGQLLTMEKRSSTASMPNFSGQEPEASSEDENMGNLKPSPFDARSDDAQAFSSFHVPLLPSSTKSFRELTATVMARGRDMRPKPRYALKIFTLVQCTVVGQRVLYNLIRLKETGYLNDRISLVVADSKRPGVAHLRTIGMDKVQEILNEFNDAMHSTARSEKVDYATLTLACESFLGPATLGLDCEAADEVLWRSAIHLLDAAVVLYAGAHTSNFVETYLNEARATIQVPGPFQVKGGAQYSVALRSLQCLDGMLGSKVWVVHGTPEPPDDSRLWLATRADTIADIWGPMSKIEDASASRKTLGYRLGAGLVLPAKTTLDMKLEKNEVTCHWLSDTAENVTASSFDLVRGITETDVLVIGLPQPPFLTLKDNCQNNIDNSREGRLVGRAGAVQPDWVQETRTLQTQLGASFKIVANFMGGLTFKCREGTGRSYKEALIHSWDPDTPGLPNLADLKLLIGLEISLCTENARRVPLSKIIVSEYMQRHFDYEVDSAVVQAVRQGQNEPRILQELWDSNHAWRPALRKAIHSCLRKLQFTGLSDNSLYALSVPRNTEKSEKRWSIPSTKWMAMLDDTFERACFAIMVEDCFEVDWSEGRNCQARTAGPKLKGKSALQTSLDMVEGQKRLDKLGLYRDERNQWTRTGTKRPFFDLGRIGCLNTTETLRDGTAGQFGFRVKWSNNIAKKTFSSDQLLRATEANGEKDAPPLQVIIEDA